MPPPVTTPGADLVGRADERSALRALLDRVALGLGGSAALVGEPGVGKSTLLEWFADEARAQGATVLRAAGSEAESDLPWAGLSAICLDRSDLFDRLPGPQGRALRAALAIGEDHEGIDRLAVSLGALGLLSAAAREAPLVVVVDDLQWLDPESRRALAFIGRRLVDDPVVLVTASRPGPGPAEADAMVLGELDDAAMDELLLGRGVRARPARQLITELARGGPLLAVRLAATLRPDERSGARAVPESLRVPADVSDLYRHQLVDLGDDERQALAVVAADAVHDTRVVLAALGQLGLGVEHLEPAEDRGLVVVDGSQVRFTHPLARAAVYQAVPGPVRRRAHRALAEAEGPDQPRGVLHRAAAAVGPDPAIADGLDRLAVDAQHRGAALLAARRLAEAAALTVDAGDQAGRLVRAAQAASLGGELRWAADLLDAARRASPERTERLDARRVDLRLAVAAGDVEGARAQAEAADVAFSAVDPVGVAELLGEVARSLIGAAPFSAAPLTERIWQLVAGTGGPAERYGEVLYGCGRFIQGDAEGAARHTEAWRWLLREEGPVAAGAFLAETVVLYQAYSNQVAAALRLLDEVEDGVRRHCATGALVSILSARSVINYQLDLRECVSAGREALHLSTETGQPGLTPAALSTVLLAAASVGDEPLTLEVSARLLDGDLQQVAAARAGLARWHLGQGRPASAAEQFALLREQMGPQNLTFTQFEADEAEALVRTGHPEGARALLTDLEGYAATGPWAVGQLERIRGLLVDDIDEANAHFEAARAALACTENRIAQGVVELLWGERLRRAKRRAEARRQLERAVDLFTRAGAVALRRRAEEELVAAGGVGDRSRPTNELLGPMELQVARLAVGGATNRDIANQLFVSPRTVENHLTAVYRKLGVSGRPALLNRAGTDEALQPVARRGPGGA